MRWIRQHKLISCLIVVIILATILLISALDSKRVGNGPSSLFGTILTTIEQPFVKLGNSISSSVDSIFSADEIKSENEALKDEIAQLKEQLQENKVSRSELNQLKELSKALNYDFVKTGKIATGDIISYDGTNFTNIFTINVGKDDGVRVNDTVVYGNMLVGRVSDVGKNWAKVIAIIDESCNASFRSSRNEKLVGVLNSSSDGQLEGFMLDSKTTIAIGDKIVTTGMGLYPRGIEIGSISKVTFDSNSRLTTVLVKPSVAFNSLQKVSVIK